MNMGIKNFFVSSRSITGGMVGLSNYLNYLEDEKHKNHGKTESIIRLGINKERFLEKTNIDFSACQRSFLDRKEGGRPPSVAAQSFCISFPDRYKPTKKELIHASKRIMLQISHKIGVDYQYIIKNSFINVHVQNNTHINIVVPRRLKGASYAVELSRPSLTNALKISFGKVIYELYGVNEETYDPDFFNIGKNKIDYLLVRDKKGLLKLIDKVAKQIDKFVNAVIMDDYKQYKRQLNRIEKSKKELRKYDDEEAKRMIVRCEQVMGCFDEKNNSKNRRRIR